VSPLDMPLSRPSPPWLVNSGGGRAGHPPCATRSARRAAGAGLLRAQTGRGRGDGQPARLGLLLGGTFAFAVHQEYYNGTDDPASRGEWSLV